MRHHPERLAHRRPTRPRPAMPVVLASLGLLAAIALLWAAPMPVASDLFPSGVEGESHPVHLLVLYALGMPIFDNLDLEAVAAAAAERGRWEFLLTAAPMRIPGGTGSPLNPIATF